MVDEKHGLLSCLDIYTPQKPDLKTAIPQCPNFTDYVTLQLKLLTTIGSDNQLLKCCSNSQQIEQISFSHNFCKVC